MTVFQYNPMQVGKFIKLPPVLAKSRCVIIPRMEHECFRYSTLLGVLMAMIPRPKYVGTFNIGNVTIMGRLFNLFNITANFDSLPEDYFWV